MDIKLKKNTLLILLILGDLIFITLHILHTTTPLLPNNVFSIELDRGYGEYFQYVKELAVVVFLILVAIRRWELVYLIFSMLFAVFLLDDALQLHERGGAYLARLFNFQARFGLRAIDFGELLVYALIAAHFVVLLGIHYAPSETATKAISNMLIFLVLLLAFFGVIFDMFNIAIQHPIVTPILGILDDGGEMLVMSVVVWYAYGFHTSSRASRDLGETT